MSLAINEFFTELDKFSDHVPLDTLVDLMRQVDISIDDVGDQTIFCDTDYERNLWRCNTGYAALILCWKPGQASPVHDHRGSACGVRVLQGKLQEIIYKRNTDQSLSEDTTNIYEVGHVCGSYDGDIHIIANNFPGEGNLVTLHIYTPPLTAYHVFNLADGSFELHKDSTAEQQAQQLTNASS